MPGKETNSDDFNGEVAVLRDKLDRNLTELRKREFHLAELIDEVTYAEGQKEKSIRRAESEHAVVVDLVRVVDSLLGYVIALEGDVLLPAFLQLSSMVPPEPNATRASVTRALDGISGEHLSERTKKLIRNMKNGPPGARVEATRERILREAADENVDVNDSIVLCTSLLQIKMELNALLDDVRTRVQLLGSYEGSPMVANGHAGRSVSPTSEVWRVMSHNGAAAANADEVQFLRDRITALETQNAQLNKSQRRASDVANESLVSELEDKSESLEKRLANMQERVQKEKQRNKELTGKLDEAEAETQKLEAENRNLRRELAKQREKAQQDIDDSRERIEAEKAAQARKELDRVIRESSQTQAALEAKIARLEASVELADSKRKEYGTVAKQTESSVANLKRENGALKKELFAVQQKLISSSPSSPSNLESKVRKLEEIITGLREELESVEHNVTDVEKQYQEERLQIVATFDEERKSFQKEREECDNLVARLSAEFDALRRENNSLRAAAATRAM